MRAKKQITLQIPNELLEKVRKESELKGMTVNETVNIILYDFYFRNVGKG
ncbi:hypothetical protein V062_00026 [Staphylococcus aureus R0357]|nr:hypothetical protein V061_00011 [Staphylococcus aureus R0353]EZY66196.1 hypothetical protein V060_00011 [Staphylococcus aureus R0294]EZY68654.1 hypothetical protein V064_02610 [Staphylococcus aureus R0545]EZY68721.1 hypothetical protein V062_00026 [Staphylococcus aureus R0357]EZY76974.1 hypothetical protein V065_00010 [Staphylococcus aureus R0611]EZY81254.1 hypothetical protein V066_01065 [Staphylococcus aureus R0615]